MVHRYRRLVALVLVPLVLNALGWGMSAAALADQSEGTGALAVSVDEWSPDADSSAPKHFEKNCSHGCHAAGHLLGQVGGVIAPVIAPPAKDESVTSLLFLAVRQPDSLFRPPRNTSLA